jgi:hypothetical protein
MGSVRGILRIEILTKSFPSWQPGLAVVDITNPAACDWYTAKLSALMDLGVDCFKVRAYNQCLVTI